MRNNANTHCDRTRPLHFACKQVLCFQSKLVIQNRFLLRLLKGYRLCDDDGHCKDHLHCDEDGSSTDNSSDDEPPETEEPKPETEEPKPETGEGPNDLQGYSKPKPSRKWRNLQEKPETGDSPEDLEGQAHRWFCGRSMEETCKVIIWPTTFLYRCH